MKLKRNQLKMKLLQVENVNLLLVHLFSWFLGVSVVKITGFSILGGRGSPLPHHKSNIWLFPLPGKIPPADYPHQIFILSYQRFKQITIFMNKNFIFSCRQWSYTIFILTSHVFYPC